MPPAVTIVHNQSFSTSSGTGGERINIDYRMNLIKQRESSAPFLALMLNINNEATKTHQFNHFTTRPNPKKSVIAGAVAVGAAANTARDVIVADAKVFNVGDIVIATGAVPGAGESKYGRVRTVTVATNTLSVGPNDPTMIIAAMGDGETLQVWGNSFAQGTLSANPSGTKPALSQLYTQIFKNAYQVNKTQANNRLYGAPERDRLRGEKEIEHVIEIEKALINADGSVDTTNDTDPRTNITGLLNQISTNVLSYGADLSQDELFDFMNTLHAPKYAPDGKQSMRMVLASASIMGQIAKLAIVNRAPMEMVSQYGVDIGKVTFNGRTWKFIEHPVLSDFLPGSAIVFHPRYVKLREFRPTVIQANIQANDADYFKDQFMTEVGLEVQLEELHGLMQH